jgi:DNA-binding response OmpR family regulator
MSIQKVAPEKRLLIVSEASNTASTGLLEFGDFTIDLQANTATVRGVELEITSEELDVLVFLAKHPRRLVTPTTVLASDWTESEFRQVEFLKVLLSLRKKLETIGDGRHYLRTEPWVVYRFDACADELTRRE